MPDRGGGEVPAAGGPIRHVPVLRAAVIAALGPRPGGTYLDATFGAGGYSWALLAIPDTRVIALDRDPEAIAAGQAWAASQPRLVLRRARFGDIGSVLDGLSVRALDGAVFDIGVSSMQIDSGERGFSFRVDGPLDMRMSGEGPSAADIVNMSDEADLADILFHFGEERASRRIARAIVADRARTPFTRTRQLAEMIARVVPAPPNEIHPATRSFQALRIAVNDELGELVRALAASERWLAPGGVLAVVSFHSLEDRIVKRFLRARSGRGEPRSRHLPAEIPGPEPTFTVEGRQPIVPSQAEIADNPRARSAKLRVAKRSHAPPQGLDPGLIAMGELPARRGR